MSLWKSAALALILGKQVNSVTSNSWVLFGSNPLLSEVQLPTPSLKVTIPLVVFSCCPRPHYNCEQTLKVALTKKNALLRMFLFFFFCTGCEVSTAISVSGIPSFRRKIPFTIEEEPRVLPICFPRMCVEVSTSPILSLFTQFLEMKRGSFHLLGNTLPIGPSPWPPALSGSSLFLPVLLLFS